MIEVEIWSDIVCPFCYIGKRNFETALLRFEKKADVKIIYRSFELMPTVPKNQTDSIYEMLAKRYGRTVEWAKDANQKVVQTAKQAGLTFNMDLVKPTNSFDAHRLTHLAAQDSKQDQIHELLFAAYFTEGKDIADNEVLTAIGAQAGLDAAKIKSLLSSDEFSAEVRSDEEAAQGFAISGVPFFLFNRKYAVSGAQPPDAFLEALQLT